MWSPRRLGECPRRPGTLYACFCHEFPQYLPPSRQPSYLIRKIARRVVMIRTLIVFALLLWVAHSVLLAQTDTAQPPSQNGAEQNSPPKPAQEPPTQPAAPAQTQTAAKNPKGFVLEDGTPVRLRTGRNISSADARVGDTLDFEVMDDVRVDGLLVIPKGEIAFATVTEAQSKRRIKLQLWREQMSPGRCRPRRS